jgi:hypothetical protein
MGICINKNSSSLLIASGHIAMSQAVLRVVHLVVIDALSIEKPPRKGASDNQSALRNHDAPGCIQTQFAWTERYSL